jgi:hypothetical protein
MRIICRRTLTEGGGYRRKEMVRKNSSRYPIGNNVEQHQGFAASLGFPKHSMISQLVEGLMQSML